MSGGRAGQVLVTRDGQSVAFPWEFDATGLTVEFVEEAGWPAFCAVADRAWALPHRDAIQAAIFNCSDFAFCTRVASQSGSYLYFSD